MARLRPTTMPPAAMGRWQGCRPSKSRTPAAQEATTAARQHACAHALGCTYEVQCTIQHGKRHYAGRQVAMRIVHAHHV
eukprot:41357-Eustigmatos_ZCMA.PRE.1